jgi:hypothetical protein
MDFFWGLCLVSFFCLCSLFVGFWFGGHSGGVTPGLVSIPEVKSSCVFGCTVGLRLWEPFDAAGHPHYTFIK